MRWQSTKKRVAAFAAASLITTLGAASLGLVPASAAVPAAQSTTAFCVNVPAGFGGFTDISGSIHRRTIECLAYSEVTSGKTPTTFAPNAAVTRGQMASFIARTIDTANNLEKVALASLPANPPNKFSDDNGNIHEANINRLAAAGIVGGKTATTFAPNEIVTRGQMASFINNAQKFLSNGVAFATSSDYFVDDENSVHEANINAIAAAGITAGVDATHYAPNAAVLRGNMATFITRYLAVLHKSGAINPLPPDSNATLAFAPTSAARIIAVTEPSTADERVYTATGLAAGTYRVTLVQSSLVTKTNNTYMFTEDGTTDLASAGTVGGQIVTVNFGAVTPAQSIGGITPVSGSITVAVDAVDYSKLLPVIYTDQGGDNTRLNLNSQNFPTEPFGVAGELETLPVLAPTGALGQDATVVMSDETANLLVAAIGSTQRTYLYDSNDTFYRGSVAPANALTMAQFEALLGKGDLLDGTTSYQATSGVASVFVLENVSPPAPITHVVTPVGERDATITIDNLVSGASAKVFLGADGATFAASTLKTTSSTDADAALAGFQVKLTGLNPGTSYEYYVTQVIDGEESDPATTVAGAGTSLATTPVTLPKVVGSAEGRPGTTLKFNFSEPVQLLSGSSAVGAKFKVSCGLLGVVPTFNATGSSATLLDADTIQVGFNGSVPAADGGVTVCTATLAAGAVEDATHNQNVAQSAIPVP